MALVLGVSKGDTFLIGSRQIEVVDIANRARITLKRDDGEIFTVRRHLATEVFNGVFISTGARLEASRRARLVFNAPGLSGSSAVRSTDQLVQLIARLPDRYRIVQSIARTKARAVQLIARR